MTWPVPSPDEIATRQAAALTAALGDVDAISPYAPLGAISRAVALSVFGVHVEQARLAQELMPDTATDWLDRHGAIWGVPREQPTTAAGQVLVTGDVGVPVPAGTVLVGPGGVQLTVSSSIALGSGSTAIPIVATLAGVAGNVAPAVLLTFQSPVSGVSPQVGIVDSNGITGGTDLESAESWRARILQRIRRPPAGGAAADYRAWALEVAPTAIVTVAPGWVGGGTVGVLVALAGPSVADGTTIAAIQANVDAKRPVTAEVHVVAATLHPIAFTMHLNPDTSATRAAALAALTLALQADADIGGIVYMSRLDAALQNASGEFSHERTAPSADVVLAPAEVAALGAVTWV